MIFRSERSFQFWEYRVGHQQMLIRSPETAQEAFNIDLVFQGVDHIDLPHRLEGLTVTFATEEVADQVHRKRGSTVGERTVFCFESGGIRGTVAAVCLTVFRNRFDLFESSLESFSITDPERDRGEVIVHASEATAAIAR